MRSGKTNQVVFNIDDYGKSQVISENWSTENAIMLFVQRAFMNFEFGIKRKYGWYEQSGYLTKNERKRQWMDWFALKTIEYVLRNKPNAINDITTPHHRCLLIVSLCLKTLRFISLLPLSMSKLLYIRTLWWFIFVFLFFITLENAIASESPNDGIWIIALQS